MEPDYLMKTDVYLNPNISKIKRFNGKQLDNKFLLVVAMLRLQQIPKENLNLPLNLFYFHFSTGSSTFLIACWLSIFVIRA